MAINQSCKNQALGLLVKRVRATPAALESKTKATFNSKALFQLELQNKLSLQISEGIGQKFSHSKLILQSPLTAEGIKK
ncbi:hypothetical protein VNO77_45186 [Canavalia gladiata]|uniref:Uncharacterized protein n=1 Tax=Canavalia gladiata TaxID=3824 RepID=A0AAN9JU96_CANGL